jgi:hypothetical protein
MANETPPETRSSRNPPEWYWLFAFPLATALRYVLTPDGLSRITGVAWWLGSLLAAILFLWIVWTIGRRLRSS